MTAVSVGCRCVLGAGLVVLALACSDAAPPERSGAIAEWPEYGGDKGGLRYSPLDQIDVSNVGDLEVAWVYEHGDRSDGSGAFARTSFQATPIVADGTLYF